MPWIVGIDEAGYGPNLGPLVMAAVACRVPSEHTQADFWQLLKSVVRRHKERDDGRLLIGDSKQVYSPNKGLKLLERGVLAALGSSCLPSQNGNGLDLAGWIEQIAASAHLHLREECWYDGKTLLPVQANHEELQHVAGRFHKACGDLSLHWSAARCVIVCPPRFNALLERWQNKSLILMLSLAELLAQSWQADSDGEPVWVFVDKHGGRNNYTYLLEKALPGGLVEAEQQSAECSAYRVAGMKHELHIQFEPKADTHHFPVALASMLAKYLRELLMLEFNAFWQQHLPDLEPTAGYPGDALRFLEAIRPVAEKLGIEEKAIWRKK